MPIHEKIVCAVLSVLATGSLFACASTSVSPSGIVSQSPNAAGWPEGVDGREAPGPVASTAEIAGQWDIVRFEHHEPRRLQGTTRAAFADFRPDGVALRIECNYSGAQGRVEQGRFVPRHGDRPQTAMGCGPEREARDTALFGFFDRSPTVERLGDGRLRLTASGSELLLKRPARRRLAYLPSVRELLGEWRLAEVTRYHPEGGYSGVGLSEIGGHISFDGITVAYSVCPQFALRYRYTGEGQIEKIGGAAIPAQRVGCDALKGEDFGRDMPVPWDVLRVLHGNPLVERVDADTLLVSNDEYGVLLNRQK